MSEMVDMAAPVVLVVAPPGYYRDSLVALLDTVRRSQRVLVTADLHQADSLSGLDEPEMILLAAPPPRLAMPTLKPMVERMRRAWPQARIVLLTDASEDQPARSLADARLRTNASARDLGELFDDGRCNAGLHIAETNAN